MSTNAMDEDIL